MDNWHTKFFETPANVLTSLRLFGILIWLVLGLSFSWNNVAFAVIYVLLGLSDLVDGTVARLSKTKSEFGAKLDAVSDSFYLAAGAIFIIFKGLVPAKNLNLLLIGIFAILFAHLFMFIFKRRIYLDRGYIPCTSIFVFSVFLILTMAGIYFEWLWNIVLFMMFYYSFYVVTQTFKNFSKGLFW